MVLVSPEVWNEEILNEKIKLIISLIIHLDMENLLCFLPIRSK